ncbi:MAG: PhoX family phosphatase [Synechococcales bacterium]|nr:PhoX family phosphatase [Synechococcales bacterium]
MIHDNGSSNKSKNRSFEDILRARMSRRNVLARGAALSATGFLAAIAGNKVLSQGATAATAPSAGSSVVPNTGTAIAQNTTLIGFDPVLAANGSGPVPNISAQYQYDTLIPWGTPIQPGGPSYDGDPNTRPTSAEQAEQVGIGHDGMHLFAIEGSNTHGMLAINHEFGINPHVLGKDFPESLEDVRLSQHAHGVSVVEIKEINGKWQNVGSNNARRVHVNTPVTYSGPAAGHPLLRTPAGNAPLGTVNNCANGYTPWDTYLTCEENFNGYFGANGTWTPTEAQDRYGFSEEGFGYGWHVFDARFDLSNPEYTNEENRFGWVVEIDPFDASQTPVKRTALGRFKHESAEVVVGQGNRIVVYMGDDERFDYIYKFVSANDYEEMFANGNHPLDRGVLYVAKFAANGTGRWLPLTINNPALKGKFKDQAEILTYTRLAADALGATPMDRPEWISTAPNGDVFVTLTNNSRREEPNAPNPLAPNPDGHILKISDRVNHIGTSFTWDIYILAQDTHGEDDERTFASPDGLWADPDGRLFIETDGTQPKGLNDQLLVADSNDSSNIRRLFTGVTSCEITGIATTPNRQTLFCNIQHPGDGDPTLTNFPAPQDGVTIPRDVTIVITRKDGGIVGS